MHSLYTVSREAAKIFVAIAGQYVRDGIVSMHIDRSLMFERIGRLVSKRTTTRLTHLGGECRWLQPA